MAIFIFLQSNFFFKSGDFLQNFKADYVTAVFFDVFCRVVIKRALFDQIKPIGQNFFVNN